MVEQILLVKNAINIILILDFDMGFFMGVDQSKDFHCNQYSY